MSVGDQTIAVISSPNLGSGQIDLDIAGSIYQGVTTFSPGLTNQGTSPITGKWAYRIAINPGVNSEISAITMDSEPPLAKAITKKIYLNAGDLASGNAFSVLTPLTADILTGQGMQTLYIEDEYSVSPGESLTGFTNVYQQSQVPAPLPALGAGAAFGYSRRLRRRIQQSHT